MWSGSEAGSYLRLIDSCISQLKAEGPFRTCNESKEEEEASPRRRASSSGLGVQPVQCLRFAGLRVRGSVFSVEESLPPPPGLGFGVWDLSAIAYGIADWCGLPWGL